MNNKREKLNHTRQQLLDEQDCVSVAQFAELTRYSANYIYRLCRWGKLGATFQHHTWLIPREVLERVLKEFFPDQPPALRSPGVAVHIRSIPIGAEIFVDGKFYGNAPFDITLPSGEHVVRVRDVDSKQPCVSKEQI
jgi:hypothetical protein